MNSSNISQRTAAMAILMHLLLAAVVHSQQSGDDRSGAARGKSAESIPSQISVRTASTRIQVAEPVNVEVILSVPVGAEVVFPSVPQMLGDFEVVDQRDRFDIPSETDVERRTWTRVFTVESIVTGELTFPALEVIVTTQDGRKTLVSEAIRIEVTSVLDAAADPTQFRDIESVVDVPTPSSSSKWWLGSAILIATGLLVTVATAVWLRRHPRRITPYAWAKHELSLLADSPDFHSTDNAPFFRKLTDILREYLELQFGVATSYQTSQELISALKREQVLSKERLNQIESLLATAEQAKFAGLELDREELRAAVDTVLSLIDGVASTSSIAGTTTSADGQARLVGKSSQKSFTRSGSE